jgi:hypothetical protein
MVIRIATPCLCTRISCTPVADTACSRRRLLRSQHGRASWDPQIVFLASVRLCRSWGRTHTVTLSLSLCGVPVRGCVCVPARARASCRSLVRLPLFSSSVWWGVCATPWERPRGAAVPPPPPPPIMAPGGAGYCNWPCWLVFLMLTSALVTILSGLVYVITNPVIESVFATQFVISSNVRTCV